MKRGVNDIGNNDLLFLLGEELKQPLIAISQLSELQGHDETVNVYAKKALRSIDNMLLYGSIHSGQSQLRLEPVHVGSAIHDVSVAMEPLMRSAGCHTDIKIQSSLSPVDVDKRVLQGALQGMWQALLGTITKPSDVICRAQNAKGGIRVSITSSGANIDELSLAQANTKSTQPVKSIAGPATDLIAAHGMLELLGSNMTTSRGKQAVGFGVTFRVSKQLQVI